jgi:hypothetical protein
MNEIPTLGLGWLGLFVGCRAGETRLCPPFHCPPPPLSQCSCWRFEWTSSSHTHLPCPQPFILMKLHWGCIQGTTRQWLWSFWQLLPGFWFAACDCQSLIQGSEFSAWACLCFGFSLFHSYHYGTIDCSQPGRQSPPLVVFLIPACFLT